MASKQFKDVFEFQQVYKTKAAREKALKSMTNAEINRLIATCGTNQAKIYYASFKK